MPLDEPLLVRCASCAHNFETRRTGRLRCPICKATVWLEPPPGQVPDPPEGEPAPPTARPAPVEAEVPRPEDPGASTAEGGADGPSDDVERTPAEQAEMLRRLLAAGMEQRPSEDVVPLWEAGQGGLVRRFYETCRQILTNPPSFFFGLRVDRLGGSWTFGWLLCSLAAACGSLYGLWNLDGNQAALLEALRAEPGVDKPEEVLELLRGALTFGLWGSPLLGLVNLWGSALLIHLGVAVIGRDHRGFRATFRATAYGFAPLLLAVVPVIGQLVGSLWSLVLQVVAIAHVHRMSPARAALAVLLPLTVLLGLVLAFV